MASFLSDTSVTDTSSIKLPYHYGNTKLLGSRQDYVIYGETSEYKYHVILDGHGKGKVAKTLSTINWDKVISTYQSPKNMLANINKHILRSKDTKYVNNVRDGTTCNIVLIFEKTGIIKTFNIGDSMTGIKINDTITFTKMHNAENESEIQRIQENGIEIEETWALKVLSSKSLDATMKKGKYFKFKYEYPDDTPVMHYEFNTVIDKLAMTRSIGHNHAHHFVTLQDFECETYSYTPGTDTVTIISASDGLWDVLCPEATRQIFTDVETSTSPNPVNNLLDMAENLWTATWNYHTPSGFTGYGDPPTQCGLGGADDVGIAVYHCK